MPERGELAASEQGQAMIADARAQTADLIALAVGGVDFGELLYVAYLRGARTAARDSRAMYGEALSHVA